MGLWPGNRQDYSNFGIDFSDGTVADVLFDRWIEFEE
jgi:hypothetical protein